MKKIILIISLGIFAALFAVFAEQLLAVLVSIFWKKEIIFDYYGHLGIFLIAATLIEEGLKYSAIYFLFKEKFDLERARLWAASLTFGLFFGLTELLLIIISNEKLADLSALSPEVIFSLATIILIQALNALLIGAFLASRFFSGKFIVLKILFFPVLIHLLYNFLIIQKSNFTNWLVGIVLGITLITSLVIIAFNFRELD
ncbi:MAG: hypothetical protein Q8L09_04065 [Candidatus Moranbacteria bacterium]|nr:hypothetical protein [Candidatus Moranbacteria bacterium]